MFIKIVRNKKGACFAYLTESYREKGQVKHRVLKKFGAVDEEQIPYLKAMYAKHKPRLLYEQEEKEKNKSE